MKHNLKSPFEKSPNECPRKCAECAFFEVTTDPKYGGTCTANGCRAHAYDFHNPSDCPLPLPLNCFWWYASSVWDKVSETKISEYREERLHLFVAFRMLETLEGTARRSFVEHVHRPGGYGLIDFEQYPQAKPIYQEIKEKEQERGKRD